MALRGHVKALFTDAGQKPAGEPRVRPSGNREFVVRDPDGYELVFFQKR